MGLFLILFEEREMIGINKEAYTLLTLALNLQRTQAFILILWGQSSESWAQRVIEQISYYANENGRGRLLAIIKSKRLTPRLKQRQWAIAWVEEVIQVNKPNADGWTSVVSNDIHEWGVVVTKRLGVCAAMEIHSLDLQKRTCLSDMSSVSWQLPARSAFRTHLPYEPRTCSSWQVSAND